MSAYETLKAAIGEASTRYCLFSIDYLAKQTMNLCVGSHDRDLHCIPDEMWAVRLGNEAAACH